MYQGSNPARRGVPSLLVCKAAIYTGLLGGFVRVLWGLDGWVAFFVRGLGVLSSSFQGVLSAYMGDTFPNHNSSPYEI